MINQWHRIATKHEYSKCTTSNGDPHEEGWKRPPRDGLIQGFGASENIELEKETSEREITLRGRFLNVKMVLYHD